MFVQSEFVRTFIGQKLEVVMNNTLKNDSRYKFQIARFDLEALMITSSSGVTSLAESFFLRESTQSGEIEILHQKAGDTVSLPVSVGCRTVVVFAGEEPVMLNQRDRFGNAQIVLSKDSVVSVTFVPMYKSRRRVYHRKIFTTIIVS